MSTSPKILRKLPKPSKGLGEASLWTPEPKESNPICISQEILQAARALGLPEPETNQNIATNQNVKEGHLSGLSVEALATIQSAMDYFDSQARVSDPAFDQRQSEPARMSTIDGFLDLSEKHSAFLPWEKFSDFQFDETGRLVYFQYAGLEWKLDEYGIWVARDRQFDYRIDGSIIVNNDGSITVLKTELSRTILPSGKRIDNHSNGSHQESWPTKSEASPYDLLARSRPITHTWMNPRANATKGTTEIPLSSRSLSLVHPKFQDDEEVAQVEDLDTNPRTSFGSQGNSVLDAVKETKPKSQAITARLRVLEEQSGLKGAAISKGLGKTLEESLCRAVISLLDRLNSRNPLRQLPIIERLAKNYYESKQLNEAELAYLRSLRIRENYFGLKSPERAISLQMLGLIYLDRACYSQAESMLEEAIECEEAALRKALFFLSQGVLTTSDLMHHFASLLVSVRNLSQIYKIREKGHSVTQLFESLLKFWSLVLDSQSLDMESLQSEPLFKETLAEYIAAMNEQEGEQFGPLKKAIS